MKVSRVHGQRFASVFAAVALASAGFAARPALAADDGPGLWGQLGEVRIAQGSGPGTQGKVRSFYYNGPHTPLVATFDISGVSKLVTVEFPDLCKTSGATVTCKLARSDDTADRTFPVTFHTKPGVAEGASGDISYTLDSVPGSTSGPYRWTDQVIIGSGPDLVMPATGEYKDAKPGSTIGVPVVWGNHGDAKAVGFDLLFDFDRGLNFTTLPANCEELTVGGADSPRWGVCHFQDTLEPHTDYTFRNPIPVKVSADLIGPARQRIRLSVYVDGDLDTRTAKGAAKGVKGTGPALAVVVAKAAPSLRKAEVDPNDNYTDFGVGVTDNPSDVAVSGSNVSGEAGALVTATVGAKNLGPAFRDFRRSGDDAFVVMFTVPQGVRVVTVPEGCKAEVDGGRKPVPGAPLYYCSVWSLAPNAAKYFEFGLKITTKIADATGDVTYDSDIWRHDGPRAPDAFDKNKANDHAKVVVNGTAPLPGPETGLPVTGAQAGLIAAGGALVLVVGAVLFVLARRRRVITVA